MPEDPPPPARFGFIGVTTGGSLINKMFPLWAEALGLNAVLEGIDLPVGADRQAIREAILRLQQEPGWLGALITTHKVAVWEHARDLLAETDPHAQRLGEVSCLSKNESGQWVGHAKDALTAMLALAQVAPEDYWEAHPEAELLILGSGGAGVALAWGVLQRPRPPARITFTELRPERLAQARHHLQDASPERLHFRHTPTPEDADALVSHLPPFSVVVNATGLGKDRPGSPLSEAVQFPAKGRVWEFNYRGDLTFLQQARTQESARQLSVFDGWHYFLLGWAYVAAEVFHFELTPERFQQLAAAAAPLRP
ncbi:MAG: shikimate dehydrogenase family protein [bacterium]